MLSTTLVVANLSATKTTSTAPMPSSAEIKRERSHATVANRAAPTGATKILFRHYAPSLNPTHEPHDRPPSTPNESVMGGRIRAVKIPGALVNGTILPDLNH